MRSIYVAGLGPGDGRQIVELGVMELLTRRVGRTGVFRPIARGRTPRSSCRTGTARPPRRSG
nr:hypothetical protein GCM10020093_055110 [Planobispora longispora]